MNHNLLRAKMTECGYSQGQVASLIGMHGNTLSRKVNGESDFTLTEVRKLCRVLRITDPARVFDLSIDNSGGI